jgi:hypothetical protein
MRMGIEGLLDDRPDPPSGVDRRGLVLVRLVRIKEV